MNAAGSPLDYGITVRDAAMMLGVPEKTVRRWLGRIEGLRAQDGQIDPIALQEWWDYKRDKKRGSRNEVHRSKLNHYDHPDAPSREAS